MNTDERRLLTDFLQQLEAVQGVTKDPEAEALIRASAAKQPDTAYLLVQKALLQDQALKNAQAQIADLKSKLEARPARSEGGFLGGNPWERPAASGGYSAPNRDERWAPPAQAPSGGGVGGFLGNVAATAAGIAGGAFLFQGIQNLLGGGHAGSGWLGDNSSLHSADHQPDIVENVTVNEYYGDARPEDFDSTGGYAQAADYEPEADDDYSSDYDSSDDGGSFDV